MENSERWKRKRPVMFILAMAAMELAIEGVLRRHLLQRTLFTKVCHAPQEIPPSKLASAMFECRTWAALAPSRIRHAQKTERDRQTALVNICSPLAAPCVPNKMRSVLPYERLKHKHAHVKPAVFTSYQTRAAPSTPLQTSSEAITIGRLSQLPI